MVNGTQAPEKAALRLKAAQFEMILVWIKRACQLDKLPLAPSDLQAIDHQEDARNRTGDVVNDAVVLYFRGTSGIALQFGLRRQRHTASPGVDTAASSGMPVSGLGIASR